MDRRSLLLGAGGAAVTVGAAALGWRAAVGSMAEYAAYAARLRRAPDPADLRDLVRYAGLAPSSHNTQPWRFRIGDGAIDIAPDFARRTPAVDPDDHHLQVSLGCAAETLAIAGAAAGWPGEFGIAPDGDWPRYAFARGAARPDPLAAAIAQRQSSRSEYDGRAAAPAELAALEAAARVPGVALALVTERPRIAQLRDLVVAANSMQMADPAFLRELEGWIRFNPRSAMARGDGLFAAAAGNPVAPGAVGRLAFEHLFSAAAENDKYARQVGSAAGLAVFVADRADPPHWRAVGRACQRFALTATSLGLKVAFVNQPVEVAALRQDLARLIGTAGKRPDILMRFGRGPALPLSPRRPVAETLS